MKYLSEITKETYNSEKECVEAEKLFLEKQKQDEELKKQKAAELSSQKKEAANKVEHSIEELSKAYDLYAEAEVKAKEIYKKAYDDAKEVLKAAKIKVREAQSNKFNALSDFNKKFGPYKTTYTGEAANNFLNKFEKEFFSKDFLGSLFDIFNI